MYLPKHFEETDAAVLHALVRAHPFATWAMQGDDGLVVNHLPFMLSTEGGAATLIGHVARANPVWRQLGPSVIVFQGPEGYVSPSWYPSKHAHGKAVPTWNYAVVHAHGRPQAVEDRARLLEIVTRLTATHEAAQALPWAVSDAPADYIEQLLGAIVGIEMPIEKLIGKWKVSQNRSAADRQGAGAGLRQRGGAEAAGIATLTEGSSQ